MSYNGKGGQNTQRGHDRGTGSSGGRGSGDSGYNNRGGSNNRGGGAFRGGRGGGRGGQHDGPAINPRRINILRFPDLFQPAGEAPAPLPSTNAASQEDALVACVEQPIEPTFGELKLSEEITLPRRPGYGNSGKSVVLRANYFQINPNKDLALYRYQVKMTNQTTGEVWDEPKHKRRVKRAFALLIQAPFMANFRPRLATDYQSILISYQKLDKKQDSVEHVLLYAELEEQDHNPPITTSLKVSLRLDSVIDVEQLMTYLGSSNIQERCENKSDILQALNIVMARKPSTNPHVVAFAKSNKFFPLQGYLGDLKGGLGAFRGYYSSVRTATGRLLLNVNSVTSAFYHDIGLNELIEAFVAQTGCNRGHKVSAFLKGLRVHVSYLPKDPEKPRKIKVVSSVACQGDTNFGRPGVVSFQKDGINNTVEQHFINEYQVTLYRPKHGYVVDVGSGQKKIWVPAELCTVLPGQPYIGKLESEQTTEMLDKANRTPGTNAGLIVGEGSTILGLTPSQVDGPSIFGLNISPKMITVPGRVLPPPILMYANRKEVMVDANTGAWNMRALQFVEGKALANWSFLRIKWTGTAPNDITICPLVREFTDAMNKYGMRVTHLQAKQENILELLRDDQSAWTKTIGTRFKEIEKTGIRLLWIIIPIKNIPLYAKIKFLADCHFGFHTICSVVTKVDKVQGRPDYLANLALKCNLKLGGTNQRLKSKAEYKDTRPGRPDTLGIIDQGRTMVVGVDVTHPGPQSVEGTPSIAGVVASVDRYCAQWPASIRAQKSKQEMVEHMREMIIERLRMWQKVNKGSLPENIIVYRDGVSEGQYITVLQQEYVDIDGAITSVYEGDGNTKKPKVAIFIVGKRHHTRFYPTTREEMAEPGGARRPNGNPRFGTVVDRGVTSERQWDFYLQAHHGLQGTARPAHYVTLKNQLELSPDDLERMTNNLCYLWGRSTKPLSICPPAKLADRLCERGRCYLHDALTNAQRLPPGTKYNLDRPIWEQGVMPPLKDTMFYI